MFDPQKRLASTLVCLLVVACASSKPKPLDATVAPAPQADVSDLTLQDLDPDLAREAGAGTGEVVKADELPENLRAVLDAWRQGGFVWEIKRSEVLSSKEETDFLVSNLILLLFDESRAMRRTAGESDPSQRPLLVRVKSELTLCGEPGAAAVAELLGLGDDMLASLAIDTLGDMGSDAAPAVAAMLEREAAVVRYRALGCLARLPGAGAREGEVIAALQAVAKGDRSEIVRVAAVRTMGERGLFSQAGRVAAAIDFAPWLAAIEASLGDPASAVRVEALDALSTLGAPDAVPAIIDFGDRARGAERTAARRALESLTGAKLGTDFKAWKGWWAAHVAQDEN